jgi:ubiquinone/menaquinone biosynthesis C-methylase UbiE
MRGKLRQVIDDVCPPVLRRQLWQLKIKWMQSRINAVPSSQAHEQDLALYWNQSMADVLETWGEGSAWEEIQYLLINCHGKVLDIACGPGGTMRLLAKYPDLELHGIDISDLLINQAVKQGIDPTRVRVGDATRMPYEDNSFEYGYSIGSLEHFTEQGILEMLSECKRVVSQATFHMIPIASNGKNQGWLKTVQSYHNNSVEWWLDKYHTVYSTVTVLSSSWEDEISIGKWFICKK